MTNLTPDLPGLEECTPIEWRLSGADLLKHATDLLKPKWTVALLSGGRDSVVATHLAMESGLADFVLHCDTGTGLDETEEYVCRVCRHFQWPLRIYRASRIKDGKFSDFVAKYGFPGPAFHGVAYNYLKEHVFRRALADLRQKSPKIGVIFVGGGRSDESDRRERNVAPIKTSSPSFSWVSIIHDWCSGRRDAYIEEHNIPHSPVWEKLCRSGECLCGAYASKGELAELNYWYSDDPNVQMINRLQKEQLEAGRWGYEDKPPSGAQRAGKAECTPAEMQFACHRCNVEHDLFTAAEAGSKEGA